MIKNVHFNVDIYTWQRIVRIQVTKISLPIQATAEDLTDQRTRIKTKVRIVQQTATKMQMMSTN